MLFQYPLTTNNPANIIVETALNIKQNRPQATRNARIPFITEKSAIYSRTLATAGILSGAVGDCRGLGLRSFDVDAPVCAGLPILLQRDFD
ncbi:MAG: hypothetical protein DRP66_10025 [Planctomycetota bacterium]|nr:MAG: hypothetical protein DRP66_10025 [Planctomycetota bacterium]